jgi:hypothetical protein
MQATNPNQFASSILVADAVSKVVLGSRQRSLQLGMSQDVDECDVPRIS